MPIKIYKTTTTRYVLSLTSEEVQGIIARHARQTYPSLFSSAPLDVMIYNNGLAIVSQNQPAVLHNQSIKEDEENVP